MSSISSVSASATASSAAAAVAAETRPTWTRAVTHSLFPAGSVITVIGGILNRARPEGATMPFLIWEHEKACYKDIVTTISEKTNLLPDIVQMVMPFLGFAPSAGHPLTTRTTTPLPAYIPYIPITIPWERSPLEENVFVPYIKLSTPSHKQAAMTGYKMKNESLTVLDVNNSGANCFVSLDTAHSYNEFLISTPQGDACFIHVHTMPLMRYNKAPAQPQQMNVAQWDAWLTLHSSFVVDFARFLQAEALVEYHRMYVIQQTWLLEDDLKKLQSHEVEQQAKLKRQITDIERKMSRLGKFMLQSRPMHGEALLQRESAIWQQEMLAAGQALADASS